MAVNNPVKNYDFALEIDGVNQAYLQGVTKPTVELTEHKQGTAGNNPDVKTPGKKKVGDLVCEQVVPAETGDPEIWAWLETGRTGLRPAYTKIGYLVEHNGVGTPVQRWFLKNIWVKKIEDSGHDTREDNSADMMRTVTFSVEDFIPA